MDGCLYFLISEISRLNRYANLIFKIEIGNFNVFEVIPFQYIDIHIFAKRYKNSHLLRCHENMPMQCTEILKL